MASHQGLRTGLDPLEQFQSLFPGDCGIKKKKKRERNYFKFNVITIMQKRHPKLKVQARETLPFFCICF